MNHEEQKAATQAAIAKTKTILKMAAMGIGLVFFLAMASCSMTTVETGHRGVKVTLGKPGDASLPEGLYFLVPFTQHMVELDIRQSKWEGNTEAYTKDVQQAAVQFVLTYSLSPSEAHTVFREVGTDWASKLVGQVVVEEIKREIGQHNAAPFIENRNLAARRMEENIVAALAKRRVIVSGFQLTNIDYTKEFEAAVEAKVVAEQRAIEEQNRTVQIEEKAKQQIKTAEGNAQSTILNARAEAESITIRARALDQNPKLIEWEQIQMMKEKWNGALPTHTLGNSIPLINLPAAK